MFSQVECPVCGSMVPAEDLAILENGNAACAECCAHESVMDK